VRADTDTGTNEGRELEARRESERRTRLTRRMMGKKEGE